HRGSGLPKWWAMTRWVSSCGRQLAKSGRNSPRRPIDANPTAGCPSEPGVNSYVVDPPDGPRARSTRMVHGRGPGAGASPNHRRATAARCASAASPIARATSEVGARITKFAVRYGATGWVLVVAGVAGGSTARPPTLISETDAAAASPAAHTLVITTTPFAVGRTDPGADVPRSRCRRHGQSPREAVTEVGNSRSSYRTQ